MSDHKPESFEGYGKKCMAVFAVVMVATLAMVGVHFANLSTPAHITLTLLIALVNAVLVAGYLMHILTEKRLTHIVLLFTFFFFAMLFILTISAKFSVPHGTIH